LEYDDERSGSFAPLAKIAANGKNQYVVAGIVTSKRPELEKEEEVIGRINEAAKYFPLERLCLSAQCGCDVVFFLLFFTFF
jgi:methionine synthase II (cobalamin-independent)